MTEQEAIRQALFHYQAQVKQGNDYARPIVAGLLSAEEKIKRYNLLVERTMEKLAKDQKIFEELFTKEADEK